MRRWIIALGSNVADPPAAITLAWWAIVAGMPLHRSRLSQFVTSEPAEGATGAQFCNAVGLGWTDIGLNDGLRRLQRIELAFGRDRQREGWHGARPLDLDVVDITAVLQDDPELMLPHPRLAHRPFVLEPLAQLCPRFRDSRTGKTVNQLLLNALAGLLVTVGACRHHAEPPIPVAAPDQPAPVHVVAKYPLDHPPRVDELLNSWSLVSADDDGLDLMRATAPGITVARLATDAGLRRWVMWAVYREMRGQQLGAHFEQIRNLVDRLQQAAPEAPETLACRVQLRLLLLQGPQGELAQNGIDRQIIQDLRSDLATLAALHTWNGPGEFDAARIAFELGRVDALLVAWREPEVALPHAASAATAATDSAGQ